MASLRRHPRVGAAVLVILAYLAAFPVGQAAASYLVNGGAEDPLGTEWAIDGSDPNAVRRVQTSTGSPSITVYEGSWFFSFCEAPSTWGSLTQRGTSGLNESTLVLMGYFTHSGTEDDYGSVSISFYDDVGDITPISTTSSGTLDAPPGAWTLFRLEASVPGNADEWSVTLAGEKNPGLGSWTDVFFDSVALIPEPATIMLLVAGAAAVARRKR